MERVVLAGSTSDNDSAPSLDFGQFVDALARCGLMGFSRGTGGGTFTAPGVEESAAGQGIRRFVSAAERIQGVFVETMRLLDREHVDANMHRQASGAGAGAEGGGDALAREGKGPAPDGTTVRRKNKGHRGQSVARNRLDDRRGKPK